MNFVNVNDYLANIAQVARRCPTVTLRHAYMRAFREWCQNTQWLRTNVPGVTVVGKSRYALGDDPNLDIIGVFAVQATFTRFPLIASTLNVHGPSAWMAWPALR